MNKIGQFLEQTSKYIYNNHGKSFGQAISELKKSLEETSITQSKSENQLSQIETKSDRDSNSIGKNRGA